MSVSLRTIATATLAFALAVGLVTQTAVAQPAYATETSAADAQTGADGDPGDGTAGSDGEDATAETDANGEADASTGNGGSDGSGEPEKAPNPVKPDPSEEPEAPEPVKPQEAKPLVPFVDPNEMGNVAIPNVMAASAGLPSAGFKAGYIISDSNFYNGTSMTAAQIQSFLTQQVPRCTIGDAGRKAGSKWGSTTIAAHCLRNLQINTQSRSANAYCNAYTGASNETAAQIIAKVAVACGISPKVLLVRLQLEQSLVLDTWPTVRQFSFAMGWNCPDSGPGNSANCNNGSAGFLDQVYGSAWQVKRYKALPNEYRYKAYRTNAIQWHPNASCGTSNVYIENAATAALYIYTPYRPNQAALNAGWSASTNECATYGNRNFYQYYRAWFGAPNSYFPDVTEGHKFFTEIEWMGTSGLSTGENIGDGRGAIYKPRSQVTREAMAAFLYRLSGETYKAPATSPFTDVKTNHKFYREIAWMHDRGYSKGYANGTYRPSDSISREAMAAFLYRFNNSSYAGTATSPFADVKTNHKFYKEISWMRKTGLSYGNKQPSGKPKYAPYDRVTREAMAAFIYRMEN